MPVSVRWRSNGHFGLIIIDPIGGSYRGGKKRRLGDLLHYHQDLAERLHELDRTGTYGSFYIADLVASDR